MEQPENTYSQVIFKQTNDQEAKNLVNSYRFKSSSPSRYKFWNPNIQNEELARRKRQREDKYIQQFEKNDRPILVIQNKEDYQNKHLQLTQNKQEGDQYFKMSENTQEINDPKQQIMGQSEMIRRETKIHTSKNKSYDQNTHLYKIEGIEFLPQGFLELDPLLYHDEFAFENDLHKEIFNKEQRRLKAIRRKQYEMKKEYKMRNVTLFITDEKTERVMQFLEQWYFKKRRRMNMEELQLASQELDIDPEALAELQENYLNFIKIQNTKDLHKYLTSKGRIQGDNVNIPESLQKYFVKQDPNSTINSKGTLKDKSQSRTLNKSKNRTKKQGVQQKVKLRDINFSPENSKQFQNIRSSLAHDQSVSGYFEDEVNKILESMKQKAQNNPFAQQKPNSQTIKSQNSQKNQKQEADYQSIQEIMQRINGQQQTTKPEKTPKQEYLEMMREKYLNAPKTKQVKKALKTDDETTRSFSKQKKQSQQTKNKTSHSSQVKKDRRSVTLSYSTDNGDYHLIQKLEPIQVGNHYYLMSIEDHIPKNGTPSINLVTRDEQGVIISVKPISMDNMSKFYQTKVYLEPQNFTNDNQFVVVVENDSGNTLSTQKIHEKLPFIINQNSNIQGRNTVANPFGSFKDQRRQNTIHVLQPVNIGEQFYQQVVKELLDESGSKNLQIITHDSKGTVLAQDEITGDFGDQFSTVLAEDFINHQNQREFTIITMDNKGNEIARHYGTQANRNLSESISFEHLKRGKFSEFRFEGKLIQAYSIPIVISNHTFFKQKLYEEVGTNGYRIRYLTTINEKGVIVSRDFIGQESLANQYYSQILKEYQQNGIPYVLLATKNDREEVINIKELCTYNDEEGIRLIEEFKQNSKSKTSYVQNNLNKSQNTGKCHLLHPVIFKNKFFQQKIQEQEVGKSSKPKLITSNEKGEILSNLILSEERFKGQVFQTKITPTESLNKIKLITLNELGEIVCQQELEENFYQILNDQYVENFDKKAKAKSLILTKKIFHKYKVQTYELRPADIENITFQQIILEHEDEFKEKERILFTRDQNGHILAAESIRSDIFLSEQIVQKFKENEENPNAIVICLFNEKEEEIGKQVVVFSSENVLKSFQIQKVDNKIRHTIQLKQCGLNHYEQVIEEILNGDRLTLKIKNVLNGEVIEEQEVSQGLVSNSYDTKVMGSYINNEGKRKTTLYVYNDKNQVLGQFDVENKKEDEKFDFITNFDGISANQLRKNTVESQTASNGRKTTIKKLRSTQYGRRTYDCYFEEVIGNDGFKRLTLVVKNEEQKEVVRQQVESDFMAEEYECFLEQQIGAINEGKNLVFRNSKNRLLKVNNLIQNDKDQIEEKNFDEIQNIFDDIGRRQSSIYTQKTPQQTIVSHKLKPTLIGSQYYQLLINEYLENKLKSKVTLFISNEQGKMLSSKELPLDTKAENYTSEILEEVNKENKERKVTLVLKDQNKREVISVDLSPHILNYYQDLQTVVIEEILSEDGKKKITLFSQNNQSLQTIEEQNESEDDNKMSYKDKIKHFEQKLNQYGEKVSSDRFSVNSQPQSQIKKVQTINVLQKDSQKKYQSFGTVPNDSLTKNDEGQNEIMEILNEVERKQSIKNEVRKSSISPQTLEKLNSLRLSTTGEIDESQLQRQVSMLMNQKKESIIQEILSELVQQNENLPEDEIEEFLEYCRGELMHDQSYKDQILMVSLFYFFLKKEQGWKLN